VLAHLLSPSSRCVCSATDRRARISSQVLFAHAKGSQPVLLACCSCVEQICVSVYGTLADINVASELQTRSIGARSAAVRLPAAHHTQQLTWSVSSCSDLGSLARMTHTSADCSPCSVRNPGKPRARRTRASPIQARGDRVSHVGDKSREQHTLSVCIPEQHLAGSRQYNGANWVCLCMTARAGSVSQEQDGAAGLQQPPPIEDPAASHCTQPE